MRQYKPSVGFSRSVRREALREGWRVFATLYDSSLDDFRAAELRALCEEAGIPMGYGRVGRVPTILDDDYVVELFTKSRT